jgi:hypothetical protein
MPQINVQLTVNQQKKPGGIAGLVFIILCLFIVPIT